MQLVSVIIPVYNAQKYLADTLNSVLKQSIADYEVILVNDGSQDSSLEICRFYADKDPRFKVIDKKNGGVSGARNRGMEVANGKYLLFIDADDELLPNTLEHMTQTAENEKADVVVCSVCRIAADGTRTYQSAKIPPRCMDGSSAVDYLMQGSRLEQGAWNKLFSHELVKDIRFEEGRICNEDKYYCFQALLNAKKVIYLNEDLYLYYQRETSATSSRFSMKKYEDIIYLNEIMYQQAAEMSAIHEQYGRCNLLMTYYYLLKKFSKTPLYSQFESERKSLLKKIKKTSVRGMKSLVTKNAYLSILLIKVAAPVYVFIEKNKGKLHHEN